MTNNSLIYYARTPEHTAKLGKLLASHLNPGDLVLVNGPLGAGKSALIRATIRALLNQPDLEVPSPTFLLVLPYENQDYSILHADLYRFENRNELEELGLFDDPETIKLIEWSERAPQLTSFADLIIDISLLSERGGREFHFSSLSNSRTFQSLKTSPVFDPPDNLS